ncbi:hypothetical protein [Streptomyces sp. LN590]|uniref:hypothetical protein n=1 Tax=Streptomyces sp. LN590 TaxID=3112980 RepID=UPI003712281A
MGRRLATAVHLEHPKTHELLILQPGDEPDEDVAEAVTNPDAWEDDAEEDGGCVDQDPDAGRTPDPVPEPEPEPVPEPEPQPEAEPAKPAAKARARKATGEQ